MSFIRTSSAVVTMFAALLAGAGLAIGAAWSGMLGNFAAGVFMQVLRPYKVGDFISAGGVVGTVKELGLFATTVITPDNVVTVVGNGKVFGDNIQNYSALPVRRVDCVAKVANSVNPLDAIARLQPVIAAIPNVATDPAPVIEILEFTPEGPKLCVRPFTHTDHYWQVYFDTHKAIVETFGAVEHSIPYVGCTHHHLHAPMWSRVLVRDVRTLAPVPDGQPGFLSFLSPYITSVPAHSVVMGDLAVRHPAGSCGCGCPTPWFEVLGRAGTSSNKSCAAAAADLLPSA